MYDPMTVPLELDIIFKRRKIDLILTDNIVDFLFIDWVGFFPFLWKELKRVSVVDQQVKDDSSGPDIDFVVILVLVEDEGFWRLIVDGARVGISVALSWGDAEVEIDYFDSDFVFADDFDHDVFWFEVAVNFMLRMDLVRGVFERGIY